jgi:hypothetical protein
VEYEKAAPCYYIKTENANDGKRILRTLPPSPDVVDPYTDVVNSHTCHSADKTSVNQGTLITRWHQMDYERCMGAIARWARNVHFTVPESSI